jgi:colicin import membrane protein
MKNELITTAPELKGIEKSKAEQIKATFEPMAKMLSEFEQAYDQVIAESQEEITKEITQKAKRLRLDIGKVRIETGKIKDREKAEYLRASNAIQGVHNILVWAVAEKEEKLKEIENHFELQEQKRLEALQSERADNLSPYVEDAHERKLSDMDQDVWEAYFSTKKKEHEDRIEAEKKAEAERIAREKAEAKDRERLHKENERLKKEAETKAKADKIEADKRAKIEADRIVKEKQEQEERDRLAKIEADKTASILKAAQDRQDTLESELKAKKEAERKENERIESERKAREKAPDKQKLLTFLNDLSIEVPSCQSDDAKLIARDINEKFIGFKKWAKTEIEKL